MNTFSEWLNSKLKELDWTQADLARASGLTRATISYYLGSKSKKPDDNALRKIAQAFKLPAEAVFRAAGVLPPTVNDPWIEEMNHKISQLTGIHREMAERLLNVLLIEQNNETAPTTKTR